MRTLCTGHWSLSLFVACWQILLELVIATDQPLHSLIQGEQKGTAVSLAGEVECQRKKERKKEGKKERKKERKKEGKKERRERKKERKKERVLISSQTIVKLR